MKILISAFTLWCFLVTSVIGTCPVYAQLASSQAEEFRLPAPGVRVALSSQFNPPILKGIKVHPDNLFRFDFILDQGDSPAKGGRDLKQQATKLIKYFLASLTIPEKDLWVNLSPYEKDRIIPQSFGLTEMGRDLLAEDYMLKQITASLIYPEDKIGKKFWKRIYEEAAKKFGTTDIPVNTFNKVWIIPEKAVVYENAKAGTAYVVESKLKVMLEEDYLSMSKHANVGMPEAGASQIIREIIIPELTREVNEGKNFSPLRQVYNSFILAAWYKKKIRNSILAQVYEDKKKVAGEGYKNSPSLVGADDVEAIYQRYLQAFKKGVYNYIKEEPDPVSGQALPRKYFSGGTRLYDKAEIVHDPKVIGALPLDHLTEIQGFYKDLAMDVKEQQSDLIIKLNQSLAGSGDLYRDAIGDADKVRLGYENLRRMVLGAIDKRMDVALLAVALLEENVIDQNMAEELPVFAKLEQLSRSDMTFGLLGGNMSKANMPIYEALLENFRGLDEGGELANTLVRIQEGSVKMLEILGVLRPEEADVFITKSVQGLERISAPGEDLKRRLGDVVNSYKGLTKINQQRMLKRLVPYRWLQLLSQYYGLNLSYMTFITSNQKNFLNWLSEAKDKVDTIKDRVGGNSNAWRIVIGQGIKKTDEWVVRAEPKVDEIKDRVGGSARAWHIVLSRGIEKTDEWVVQAEVKVNAIKYKVGGSNNAWVIVMGHGIEQADEWVRQAEIKVNAIKYKVRGSNNAWAIVINQGMEQADEWVRQAEIKVDAIKDKVGGSRNAWAIVIGQGIEQVDEWVARAALKVDEIEDKVGGNNNAWQIVIDQGIKKTDEWVRQAEVKVGEIKDKVGGSGKAWVIVKAQGIEQVDEWVARAALKVDEIKDKVRGNNNAWKIVIGQGIEQVDEWVARAEVKVDAIKDKVGGSYNAWVIVMGHGMQADEWVRQAEIKVREQGVNWRTLIDNGLAFDAAMTVEGPLLENLLTDPGRLYGFFKKFIDNPGDARNHEALKLFPFIGELLYPQENNLTRDLARIKDEKRGLDISLMDHIFTRGLGQKMMGLQQGDARTFNKTAALSQENFQKLVLRYQALKGDVMPFFLASFMYHEISKIRNKEFRDRWSLFEGMDFQLPNKASGNVLRHEYFFSDREPGLFNGMAFLKDRPHAKILSDFFYQILENRGFSGQFVRGEITYQNFKPLTDWIKAHFQELKEAIAPGRPDAQAAYQMTNIIFMFDFVDIASLNDQLLTDNLFVNLKALLTDFQSVITIMPPENWTMELA